MPSRATSPPSATPALPVDVAEIVKAIMVERFAAVCQDPDAARQWYARNIDVWDAAKLATHAPHAQVQRAGAAIVLEGHPDGEAPASDCWGVEISEDEAVLTKIPGWYLECWACWLVYPLPRPTAEQIAASVRS
jgi:hypothetical protein